MMHQATFRQAAPVVSKNTNELQTRALGRFGLEVYTLGWPMEAEILGHENADPAFDMDGGRHRWLGVVFYIESRRFLIRDSPRPATTYEQKTGGADGVKGA